MPRFIAGFSQLPKEFLAPLFCSPSLRSEKPRGMALREEKRGGSGVLMKSYSGQMLQEDWSLRKRLQGYLLLYLFNVCTVY